MTGESLWDIDCIDGSAVCDGVGIFGIRGMLVPVAATAVTAAPAVLRVSPTQVTIGTVSATLSIVGTPTTIAGQTISFSVGATPLCQGVTNAAGVASCTPGLVDLVGVVLASGYHANFAGHGGLLSSGASGALIS